jgi:hypothetical protein
MSAHFGWLRVLCSIFLPRANPTCPIVHAIAGGMCTARCRMHQWYAYLEKEPAQQPADYFRIVYEVPKVTKSG